MPFRELIGSGFAELPLQVRNVHDDRAQTELVGRCRVERGTGLLSRLFCAVSSLPAAGEDVPVRVTIRRNAEGETWTREFAGNPMISSLRARAGLLEERLGPTTFRFALAADRERISWNVVGVRVLGVPLPASLFSGVRASESVSGDRYRFDVEARLPVVGLLVRYQGTLDAA
ncbi:hypothetical protein DSM104443_03911 [Usitatibacter rugosus]|uniref:DUF4166 domain-containing protein n=1 Tax=Usitatibacter rugosus TaxID=2732067 RepID=A0A6M4H0Z2_9PROT|nr:DUF4166 domain-containing protein [Usitatibacter rugosus]QJR12818.1 hypothetical protein DSM104443_03911 [Usitatibacter rugosus]